MRHDSSSRNALAEEHVHGFKVNIKQERKSKFSSIVLKLRGIEEVYKSTICFEVPTTSNVIFSDIYYFSAYSFRFIVLPLIHARQFCANLIILLSFNDFWACFAFFLCLYGNWIWDFEGCF